MSNVRPVVTVDVAALTAALRAMGSSRPNAESRARLEGALSSKWDGVRVVAAQSLCRWGDAEAIAAVRKALWELSAKPIRWSATGALAQALRPRLQSNELDWVVALFLRQAHRDNLFAIAVLFEAFDAKAVASRLQEELASVAGAEHRRQCEGAIWRAKYRYRNVA